MAQPDFSEHYDAPPPANEAAAAPHAVDAERAILGALMINNEHFDDIGAQLQSAHFYDKRHQVLFGMLGRLIDKGHADPRVVAHRLKDEGHLSAAGGDEYIAELADIGAAAVNLPAYVRLVRDTAHRRLMLASLHKSIEEVLRPGEHDTATLQDQAEARLLEVGVKFESNMRGPVPVSVPAQRYFDKMTEVIDSGDFDSLHGVKTGFPKLDWLTQGLHAGDLVVIAGRPGTGKTALALNIMREVTSAKNNGAALMFSLEMGEDALTMRMLAHYKLDSQQLRSGRHRGKVLGLKDLSAAISNLSQRQIYFDDSGQLNILEAKARARRLRRRLGAEGAELKLIVVDYLQIMAPTPDGRANISRTEEVASISRGLKSLAKELQVPVVALSQLNRSIEGRDDKRPQLSDLRDSGAIEQDADLIMFLYPKSSSPPPEDVDAAEGVEVTLEVAKQRNGPVGPVPVRFYKHFSLFSQPADAYDNNNGYESGNGAGGYDGGNGAGGGADADNSDF